MQIIQSLRPSSLSELTHLDSEASISNSPFIQSQNNKIFCGSYMDRKSVSKNTLYIKIH